MKREGLTLIEILIVLVVVAILAAIIMPVAANAKRRAYEGVSISNLRQSSAALLIYAGDQGSIEYLPPTLDSALFATNKAPLCSPFDYLGSGCSTTHPSPFLGSYAYARLVPRLDLNSPPHYWQKYIGHPEATLLLDVLVGQPHIAFGESSGVYTGLGPAPDYVIRVRADGSAEKTRYRTKPLDNPVVEWFTWEPIFANRVAYTF